MIVVLVVDDTTQASTTQDTLEALAQVHNLDSMSLIVTNSVQSAITILAETNLNTESDLSPKLGGRRLNS